MALKSGLGASVGIAKEVTYGAYVAPTRHFLFTSEGVDRDQTYYKSKGLQAGSVAQQKGLVRQTTRVVNGPLMFTAMSKGMGVFFDAMTGSTVTPTGAGVAKTFVFPVGLTVPDGKSMTYQAGVPDTGGAVRVKTATGAVLSSAKFSMAVGGALEVELQFVAQDMVWTQTLATPTYPAAYEIFGFKESVLTFDGGSVGACVSAIDITVTFPRKTDRFCLNGAGTILEPISNEQVTVAGSMTAEFTTLAQANAFQDATWRALQLKNEGLIELQTGIVPELTFDIPEFLVEKASALVQGPDVVTQNLEFTAAVDAGSLLDITYVTSDTAI